MVVQYYEFFERARSKRNFIVGLVLGIIGGGIIGLLTPYFNSVIGGLGYTAYINSILALTAFILVFIAIRISSKNESLKIIYNTSIEPDSILSISRSLSSEVKARTQNQLPRLVDRIGEFEVFLSDRTVLRTANLQEFQNYFSHINEEVVGAMSHAESQLISKLKLYVETIGTFEAYIAEKSQSVGTSFLPNVTLEKTSSGFILKKKGRLWFADPVIQVDAHKNSAESLLSPVLLVVTIFPKNFPDYLEVRQNVKKFLKCLKCDALLLELGVHFALSEESEAIEKLHDEMTKQMNKLNEIINDLSNAPTSSKTPAPRTKVP